MDPTAQDRRPPPRVTIAPSAQADSARRSTRAPSLTRRQSRASSSSLDRRTSIGSLKGLVDNEPKPSPTALRLKSLARAVRASHALGTLRVRKKYVIPLNQFSSDEISMDMMAMIDDTSPIGTAPWASDGSRSERLGAPGQASPTNAESNKTRWKSAYKAVGRESQLTDEPSDLSSASTPARAPMLRKLNDGRGGSKAALKRLGSIRGDLNVLLNGPVDLQPPQQSPPQRTELPENLDARIFCARSLYKLSCQPGSELAIIQGGAIAQIADFSDIDHPKLLRYCAATLANLTTDRNALEAFVRFDGIQALLELSWAPCLHVKILCATAVLRISQHAALAQSLARSKVVIELLSMLALPLEPLQILLVSSFANLVFHGHLFPDRVFVGEPHAVQNQLGVMSVVGQFASAPTSTQFAAEVLYNLSLYRVSCAGALRGGGAEALHALAALVCKVTEESGPSSARFMSATSTPVRNMRPPWASNAELVMRMLHLIAETLGNFSAFVEFHGVLSTNGMKTLALLLHGALRDVGSKVYGAIAEKRLKNTIVACSRALANLSTNEELRKHAFTQEIVHMTTRLALLDRQRFAASQDDAQVYFHNVLRTICNLSFSDTCTAYFMEFPQVLPLLHAVAIAVEQKAETPDDKVVTPRSNLFTDEDVKEDALVTILNLAQQAAYANDLVRTLDGKKLAIAAEDPSHSGRLKYIYSLVLCNLLFESRLQQVVYGELVVRSLVHGFQFFGPVTDDAPDGNAEQTLYKALNLAFGDDQERFLAAICIMVSEIMDLTNIECVIALILECLNRPLEAAVAPAEGVVAVPASKAAAAAAGGRKPQRVLPVRRRRIACYAAAALYTLARASTQRGDTHNLIYSPAIEATLIAVCERANNTGLASGCDPQPSSSVYCSTTQAFCAASLYQMCASGHASPRIIQALIACCNGNEETLSLLACSASFAIISFTPEGRSELIASAHLAKALNRLGRTSHPECQQYAAIAACNVSTLACLWTSTELKDFIVMALLRANSAQAKQIHAKTLSNLLSHVPTREKVVEDGVLYALMKLSQVMANHSASAPLSSHAGAPSPERELGYAVDSVEPQPSTSATDEVFGIGLQALFNLSCEHQYHQRLLSNGVMPYLAAPVLGKHASSASAATTLQANEPLLTASSFLFSHTASHQPMCALTIESRRYAMGILCNLSSYAANHKELMNAQVTDLIRKYVDQDVETRASAAMALRNLSCKQPWVEMLCERKTLALLLTFTQCDHRDVRQFAVEALANCSLVTDSLHLYGELRVARAVLTLLERVSTGASLEDDEAELDRQEAAMETCMAALKCLHNLAFDDALAVNMAEESAVLRLLPLLEHRSLGGDDEACLRTATMVNTLAGKPRCAEPLLRQRVVSLCALLHRLNPEDEHIAFECVSILTKLSTYQQVQEALTETQAIDVIVSICSSSCAHSDIRIRECGAISIRNLTLSITEHLSLFYGESGLDGVESAQAEGANTPSKVACTGGRCAADQEDFETDSAAEGPRVSRLIERHLLHGIRYFQRELEGVRDPSEYFDPRDLPILTPRILQEACAAIANLSTIKVFRGAMVRLGVIDTLLRVYQHGLQPEMRSTAEASMLRKICAATLHRLVVEDEAGIDDRGLLVPSLLSILWLSDEELHHVRYECEKVSLYSSKTSKHTTGRRSALVHSFVDGEEADEREERQQRTLSLAEIAALSRRGNIITIGSDGLKHVTPVTAATHCVKQTYRDQKWTLYLLKTTLSSSSMIPSLEKKQMKVIGQPRLSCQDINTAAPSNAGRYLSGYTQQLGASALSTQPFTASNSSSEPESAAAGSSETAVKPKGGYLLPVHMDKYMIRHDEATGSIAMGPIRYDLGASDDGTCATTGLTGKRITVVDTEVTPVVHRDSPDWTAIFHARKFDRHMRSTRRNHRRHPNSTPAASVLS